MNIFKLIQKAFKNETVTYEKHYTRLFNSINDFLEYIHSCNDIDKHEMYYYIGTAEDLINNITNTYLHGESDINPIYLKYLDVKDINEEDRMLFFDDSIFIPDLVSDIKKVEGNDWIFYYCDVYYHNKKINKVIVAKDSVYFCSK